MSDHEYGHDSQFDEVNTYSMNLDDDKYNVKKNFENSNFVSRNPVSIKSALSVSKRVGVKDSIKFVEEEFAGEEFVSDNSVKSKLKKLESVVRSKVYTKNCSIYERISNIDTINRDEEIIYPDIIMEPTDG